jgi:hypothetical protein
MAVQIRIFTRFFVPCQIELSNPLRGIVAGQRAAIFAAWSKKEAKWHKILTNEYRAKPIIQEITSQSNSAVQKQKSAAFASLLSLSFCSSSGGSWWYELPPSRK